MSTSVGLIGSLTYLVLRLLSSERSSSISCIDGSSAAIMKTLLHGNPNVLLKREFQRPVTLRCRGMIWNIYILMWLHKNSGRKEFDHTTAWWILEVCISATRDLEKYIPVTGGKQQGAIVTDFLYLHPYAKYELKQSSVMLFAFRHVQQRSRRCTFPVMTLWLIEIR